jgi:hypothetical protein
MRNSHRHDLLGRLLVVTTIALAAAWFSGRIASYPFLQIDFEFLWRGARLWARGVDPYQMRPRAAFYKQWPLSDPLFYPLPSLLVLYPLRALVLPVACGTFVGCSAALLAWRSSQRALWPLLLFATPSFLMAALLGLWSPLLICGTLVPSA